jgi:hypothetical protein
MHWLRILGPQRTLLLTLVACVIAASPFAVPHTTASGWHFLPQVLAPVFAGILIFVLPLDITMSRLFQREATPPAARRYATIVRIQAWALGLLVVSWIPFVVRLING